MVYFHIKKKKINTVPSAVSAFIPAHALKSFDPLVLL